MDGSKWTKGPWGFEQCHRADGTPVSEWTIEAPSRDDDEPIIVAGVFTSEHDASLIAAAPALAEALEVAQHAMSNLLKPDSTSSVDDLRMWAESLFLPMAAAALKSAKGDAA